MEISKMPFDEKFQSEVRGIQITDPAVLELVAKLDTCDKNRAEAILYTHHRKLMDGEITQYTEQQVLQLAAVFLRASSTLNLQAGDLMKAWQKQNESAAQNVEAVTSGVSDKAVKTLR